MFYFFYIWAVEKKLSKDRIFGRLEKSHQLKFIAHKNSLHWQKTVTLFYFCKNCLYSLSYQIKWGKIWFNTAWRVHGSQCGSTAWGPREQGRTIQSWLTYSSHHMHSMYLFYSIQMQKEVWLKVFNAWKFQSIECKSGLKSQIFFSLIRKH